MRTNKHHSALLRALGAYSRLSARAAHAAAESAKAPAGQASEESENVEIALYYAAVAAGEWVKTAIVARNVAGPDAESAASAAAAECEKIEELVAEIMF